MEHKYVLPPSMTVHFSFEFLTFGSVYEWTSSFGDLIIYSLSFQESPSCFILFLNVGQDE